MSYSDTINFLFSQLPMFQRKGPAAYKNSLANTLRLDELYQHPHLNFKTIHVAGTNGKGSVSHMLASILQEAGYKTGLYTSPHLKDFRERIRINGELMPEEEVVNWVNHFRTENEKWRIEPSFFELTVAMAFDYFSAQQVDVAVVEVGLGGRLDSTNIIQPEASLITNIGLDHTALLGDTMEKIAGEKAGIIKSNIPVVVGTTQPETKSVFQKRAIEKGTNIYFADKVYEAEYALLDIEGNQVVSVQKDGKRVYPELKLDLKGNYQLKNLSTVLLTVDLLQKKGWNISTDAVYAGLMSVQKNTGLLGRWQVLQYNPMIVCDTGHNEDGIRAIVQQINNIAFKNLHIIFGTVADKDPDPVLSLLPPKAKYYFVKAQIERAMDEVELMERAAKFNLIGRNFSSVKKAFDAAQTDAGQDDMIFIGGSTFVVAEIL